MLKKFTGKFAQKKAIKFIKTEEWEGHYWEFAISTHHLVILRKRSEPFDETVFTDGKSFPESLERWIYGDK